ncbi:MAG: ankyrin repeat domain-containing protein [Planctomycetes bacterium]|nr:ankyrin repeat domain-containing protein [Planctomycetota bacterium]
MVQDFVMFGHFDLKMVEKLLAREPGLLHSHMDWGGGDFESALGGAAHVGNREIAKFLLGKGARIDIFCAAMLGQLDVVKGLLTAFPALIDAKGPHGISLHMHAKMGGKESEGTLDFLQSVKKVEFPPPKKKDPPKKPE